MSNELEKSKALIKNYQTEFKIIQGKVEIFYSIFKEVFESSV
jgi:hypothetical protein